MSMPRYVCCPASSVPNSRELDTEYICLYSSGILTTFDVGDVAINLKQEVRKAGITPSVEAWDFCSIAMAVAAVDEAVPRNISADGWTRVLDVQIHLVEPLIWQPQIPLIEKTLRFLTGDFWRIRLLDGGEMRPISKKDISRSADCVSLLSGGVDSLAGAIDICRSGKNPIFLSKLVRGDSKFQIEAASQLVPSDSHIQWRFNSRSTQGGENSTRGRSIIFFAYAALVASSLAAALGGGGKMPVYVPENGFISLNLPLTPLRQGTLSTKTTHPVYLRGLQEIWNAVGINAELLSPLDYRLKTKGEILEDCLDRDLLVELIGRSTSCGRYGVYNNTHCGRCVPCLVRRAAFIKAGIVDSTEVSTYKGKRGSYVFENLSVAANEPSGNDIRAVARACLLVQEYGVDRFISGGLSFCEPDERDRYVSLVSRGIAELETLLEAHNVL